MNNKRKLRVENFERVSTDRQETERQNYDLADNVELFNLDVIGTVRMKISGPKVNTKKEWVAMIERQKQPDRDGINLSSLDRLFRPEDFAIIAEALQVFRDYKKVIVTTKEGLIEPWTDRGWQICMEAVLQAGKELAELKRRTKGGRRKAHAQNKPMNTCVPFGILYRDKYDRDEFGKCQYFYEDPELASNGETRRAVIVMIFDWRDRLKWRTYRIAAELNRLKILTAGKKRKDGTWQYEPGLWSQQTVGQFLQNRHYIGEHIEGGVKINVACPSFIDRDVFDRVQASFAIEAAPADKAGRDSKMGVLSKYLHCRCGQKLYYKPLRKCSTYHCHNYHHREHVAVCRAKRVRAELIEPLVFGLIWKHLTNAKLLLANARAYYSSLPSSKTVAKLEKQLKSINAEIDRTQRMVQKGAYDEEKGIAEILELKKEAREIESELRTAGSVIDLPEENIIAAACRLIAEGPMPGTKAKTAKEYFAEVRPVLEKLVDFRADYNDETGYVDIECKVPVPASVQRGQKCNRRVRTDSEGQHRQRGNGKAGAFAQNANGMCKGQEGISHVVLWRAN
jgi:hypothetical protein